MLPAPHQLSPIPSCTHPGLCFSPQTLQAFTGFRAFALCAPGSLHWALRGQAHSGQILTHGAGPLYLSWEVPQALLGRPAGSSRHLLGLTLDLLLCLFVCTFSHRGGSFRRAGPPVEVCEPKMPAPVLSGSCGGSPSPQPLNGSCLLKSSVMRGSFPLSQSVAVLSSAVCTLVRLCLHSEFIDCQAQVQVQGTT